MNQIEETGANYGFIDKEKLLEYVTEEDIFELVFGFKPEEYQYTTSPFRLDSKPGCWFEFGPDGRLKFKDFGSQTKDRKGKIIINMDCFDAVKYKFNLPNLYSVLKYINNALILGKDRKPIERQKVTESRPHIKYEINFSARDFTLEDKFFWYDRYLIEKEHLIEDKVFCLNSFTTIGSKGKLHTKAYKPTYCFTEFKSGNKKIYQPFSEKFKFLTNCIPDDIGGLHKYRNNTDILVITKSYKDWRVLTNLNINSIWVTSERTLPPLDILLSYCFKHKEIIVFFDNDETGIESSAHLVGTINKYFPGKARPLILPILLLEQGISDPSDLLHKAGLKDLLQFLKTNKVL